MCIYDIHVYLVHPHAPVNMHRMHASTHTCNMHDHPHNTYIHMAVMLPVITRPYPCALTSPDTQACPLLPPLPLPDLMP